MSLNYEIVQVVRGIHPNGGISGVAFYLREEFNKKGIKNSVINLDEEQSKIKNKYLNRLQYIFDVLNFTFRASLKIKNLKKRPDKVVIVHGDAVGGDIYVDHGLHKAVVLQKPVMFLRNPFHIFLFLREEIRHRFNTYRYLVTLSKFSESNVNRYYPFVEPAKITRIPNGVNLDRFKIKKTFNESQPLKLIFVGYEYDRKGLRFILEALSLVDANVTLTVVGGTTEEIQSHKEIASKYQVLDRVSFLGRRTDVDVLFSEHDLMILPSAFESWQLVVLEAMASGLPVLGTPVGCAEEVIFDGKTGYIVMQSAIDIAEKITLINKNRVALKDMGIKAANTAQNFSWGNIAERYIELAGKVVSEKSVKIIRK